MSSPPASPSMDHGLSSYLAQIHRFPVLTAEDEYALAARVRRGNDSAAADRLATSYLRLVTKVALRYRGYGLPVSDLVAEGNIGLMKAIQKFDPDRGFRLASYAMWWIRAAIQEYVLRSHSLVRIGTTGAQKRLFFGLRRARAQIAAMGGHEPRAEDTAQIAAKLGVPPGEVVEMSRRLAGDSRLNDSVGEDADGAEWQDRLADDRSSPEAEVAASEEFTIRSAALARAFDALDDRERTIFAARRMADEPRGLEELADQFHVSAERVGQIEAAAFEKIRKSVLWQKTGRASHRAGALCH